MKYIRTAPYSPHFWPLKLLVALALTLLVVRPAAAANSEILMTLIDPGYPIVGAGDVNADGYSDVIAGDNFNADGGMNAGRTDVYFGGPNADGTPDLTFIGAPGDQLGFDQNTAGDFNGDGFDDFMITTGLHDQIAGRVSLYFGGPGVDSAPDVIFDGEVIDDAFGWSISPAGDVNGDGYDDIIIGSFSNTAGGAGAGRAYVYFGGSVPDGVVDLVLTGGAGDNFGSSVAAAGDMNGDGFDDVIVGARGADAGRADVYYGGPGIDAVADLRFFGEVSLDNFGNAVRTAGDVNGDGFDDVLIGARGNSSAGVFAGRAYLYFGGPYQDEIADLTFTGGEAGASLGDAVGTAGDVNGDGYDDFLISAPFVDTGSTSSGRVYLYYGGPDPDAVPELTFAGLSGDLLGRSVSSAGDVNGDGHPDIVFGSRDGLTHVYSIFDYRELSPNGGETWVAGQPATVRWEGRDVADLQFSPDGGASWSTLAFSVGGQAVNELVVIAPGLTTEYGRVRLTFTGQGATTANSVTSSETFQIVSPGHPVASLIHQAPLGEVESDFFGLSTGAAGDVNGDGFDDYIVGAINYSAATGRAYVYYGGPDSDEVADLTFTGEAEGDSFGSSVATAGDVNGDGFSDLLVGAPQNDAAGIGAGRVYLFLGGPAPDEAADLILSGAAGNEFGGSVATAGDLDGDGFDEFIVGAARYAGSESDQGRAYVYYGSFSPDSSVDLILDAQSGGRFGSSVSTAGDVDGDGFDDFLVGAHHNSDSGFRVGSAYLYFGGPGADAIADYVMIGEADNDEFGSPVAPAGDLNGDGFDDIVVGAIGHGSTAGRAYVYLGGTSMDSTPDLILDGEQAGDAFGSAAGTAGDLNQDGFDDFVIGAFGNDANGVNAGRAYIHYGGPILGSIADVILTGAIAGDGFGFSVGTSGDTKGDGFDDLIIGRFRLNSTGDPGQAFLYDFNRYHVLTPTGTETWNVGAQQSVTWIGAEPANILLSVDGGSTYAPLDMGVGGAESNGLSFAVPHLPSRFVKIKVTPYDTAVLGSAVSDSLFTLEASIELLNFVVEYEDDEAGGVSLHWTTDPGLEVLSGYKLERSSSGNGSWTLLSPLIRETRYHDPGAGTGTRYRLTGVNGLGEELVLAEIGLRSQKPLAAWPLPYRGGDLNLSFATSSDLGGGPGATEVSVFDIQGRRMRTLVQGEFEAGYQTTNWDGRDELGSLVPSGVYFIRAVSMGEQSQIRFVVIR